MHFSIPDTQELIDSSGNSFLGYNIHVNGLYHCTVRYKQLLNLHEQLLKDKDINLKLPQFPPKKFFPLTLIQQEDRRASLEKYIQTIGQNPLINISELLNGFLLYAQRESSGKLQEKNDTSDDGGDDGDDDGNNDIDDDVDINIYLLNGDKLSLSISSSDNTNFVLSKLLRKLNLPNDYDVYFNLYITVVDEEGNTVNYLRKLQNFESPLLTFNNINYNNDIKIILGKDYLDINNDLILMNDDVGLNLLCMQAISEINRGWIVLPKTIDHEDDNYMIDKLSQKNNQFHLLENNDEKVKLLHLIRTFKYYGYIQFAICHCDYPDYKTKCIVSIGNNELNLRIFNENNDQYEAVFKVTRMRCWRITTLQHQEQQENNQNHQHQSNYSLEISFEYLIAKNELKWITISSEQAILMSVCLQNMIDELLLKHKVNDKKSIATSLRDNKTWNYTTRNGCKRIISNFNCNSSNVINNKVQNHQQQTNCDNDGGEGGIDDEPGSNLLQKISEKFLNNKSNKKVIDKMKFNNINNCDVMENNAFHMFGDDDL